MDDIIRAVQITDTHLFGDPQGALLGVNTQATLCQVLEAVRHHPLPDMVLATGDLVHDASAQGYRRAEALLGSLGVPVHCLPGNHDEALVMRHHLCGPRADCPTRVDQGGWSLLLLNTTLAGSEGGHLDELALEQLQRGLAETRSRHVLLCMHHPPLAVGSRWLDSMQIDNPDELVRLLAVAPQVRGILCGHVHQTFEADWAGVRVLASPSTCIQFAVGSSEFGLDPLPPGYRWLELQPDGGLRSGVERVKALPEGLQLRAGGY